MDHIIYRKSTAFNKIVFERLKDQVKSFLRGIELGRTSKLHIYSGVKYHSLLVIFVISKLPSYLPFSVQT